MSKKLELCRWSVYVEVDWNVEWRRGKSGNV